MDTATGASLETLFGVWLKARRPHQGEQRAANARWFVGQVLRIWKGLEVTEITEERVADLFTTFQGRAGTTLNTQRAYLVSFFTWAQGRGLIVWNPMGAWPRQPEEFQRPQPALSLWEEDRLCEGIDCDSPDLVRRFVRFLIATGLRPVSARRLMAKDVTREKGLWLLNLPARAMKNKRGLRMVLSPAAAAALPKPMPERGPLFVGIPGRVQFWRIITAAAKRAKLGTVTPKTFRSTWVGRMCDAGATEREVCVIQGWKRANILVQHYYPEVRPERATELYRRVEER